MKEKMIAISAGIAASLTYVITQYLFPLIEIAPKYIAFLKPVIAGATIYSLFRIVFSGLALLVPQSVVMRRWLLGRKNLDGNWVGFYKGASGNIRIFYEIHTQGYEEYVIRGYSFDMRGVNNSSWVSTSSNLNIRDRKILFTYQSRGVNEASSNNGYAQFEIQFDSRDKFASKLIGFSFDLDHKVLCKSIETKVADNLSEDELKSLARKLYSENREFAEDGVV